MNRRRASTHTQQVPAWQIERANRLHRKFLSVDMAVARGQVFSETVYHFQWFWRHRNYRTRPDLKVRFGLNTLRRLWIQWRKGGRTPDALRLNYRGLPPSVSSETLCRFVEFCTRLQFPHMKDAWREFTKRNGWIGRGRRGNSPVKVTYGQLQYYFSGKKFARLQSAQRGRARAEVHLEALRVEYTNEIRARVPACPRRPTSLDRSQGSAAL